MALSTEPPIPTEFGLDRVSDEVQGFFAALAPRNRLLSDELRSDRREEVAHE